MFTNIQRPTKAVTEAMADLGLTLYDSLATSWSFAPLLASSLTRGSGSKAQAMGMTEQMRTSTSKTIAGVYGMKA
jgi:uncharacterized protein involved in response to NO